jgi:hypothetical protein
MRNDHNVNLPEFLFFPILRNSFERSNVYFQPEIKHE